MHLRRNNVAAGSQTDTTAFKKWFGKSKVVDADGKPLVLYHGTNRGGFVEFDLGKIDKHHSGFFFTNSKVVAESYGMGSPLPPRTNLVPDIRTVADIRRFVKSPENNFADGWRIVLHESRQVTEPEVEDYDLSYTGMGAQVITTFLPYWERNGKTEDIGSTDRWGYYPPYTNLVPDIREALRHGGPPMSGTYAVYARMLKPLVVDGKGAPWMHIPYKGGYYKTNQLSAIAKEKGHDGLIIRNIYDSNVVQDEISDVYVVFDPHNIKSATANVGTFDRNSADIRMNPSITADTLPSGYLVRAVETKTIRKKVRLRHNNAASGPQTETAAFKKWFGRSRVVDADGKPLVVYHGTSRGGFSVFKLVYDDRPSAVFFSNKRTVAGDYAGYGQKVDLPGPVPKNLPTLKSVTDLRRFVKSPENDFDGWKMHLSETKQIIEEDDSPSYTGMGARIATRYVLWWQKGDRDVDIAEGYFPPDELVFEANAAVKRRVDIVGIYAVYLRMLKPMVVDGKSAPWMSIPYKGGYYKTDQLADIARSKGHDGLILRNIYDNPIQQIEISDVYVVFDPHNIKSATANAGTFDPDDPSMLRNPRRRNPHNSVLQYLPTMSALRTLRGEEVERVTGIVEEALADADEDDEDIGIDEARERAWNSLEGSYIYEDFQQNMANLTVPVRVYRAVALTSVESLNTDALGVYWSWSREGARAYYLRGGDVYVLEGVVAPQDVDWLETTVANLAAPEEKEITLKEGATVREIVVTTSTGTTAKRLASARANPRSRKNPETAAYLKRVCDESPIGRLTVGGPIDSNYASPSGGRGYHDPSMLRNPRRRNPRAWHGSARALQQFRAPAFFADDRKAARWFAVERAGAEPGVLMEVELDIQHPATSADLIRAAKAVGVAVVEAPYFEAPEVSRYAPYDGSNPLDLVYIPKVRAELLKRGFDGVRGWDLLEADEIEVWITLRDNQATVVSTHRANPHRRTRR